MATVETRLMTAEEFYDWSQRPENRGRYFELERGEVVEMPPPGKYHGFVCSNANGLLHEYAKRTGRGYPCGNDAGFIVERGPDTVRGPDITFYEDDETADTMERKYPEAIPRLVVEVLSPNDHQGRTSRRVSQYLQRGVPLVWVVDPEVRYVTVYRPGKEHYTVDDSEELGGDDVLPEFRCRVADFFTRPGPKPSAE
jgi:Uma2 family endonuclease